MSEFDTLEEIEEEVENYELFIEETSEEYNDRRKQELKLRA